MRTGYTPGDYGAWISPDGKDIYPVDRHEVHSDIAIVILRENGIMTNDARDILRLGFIRVVWSSYGIMLPESIEYFPCKGNKRIVEDYKETFPNCFIDVCRLEE